MSKLILRSIFFLASAFAITNLFQDVAMAQTSRPSCKASAQESTKAQRNSEKLASQVTRAQEMLKKLETTRQTSIKRLDDRLKNITSNAAVNTANCFIGSGITSIIKGKDNYQKCLERAKRTAELAAERAAKAKINIEQQKARVNSLADSKKALLEQKVTRLQGELATQQATAASAKARYDACIAAGGI